MDSIQSYLAEKRLKVYHEIGERKKIYLDTNYWIKLRDANKNQDQLYIKLLERITELVVLNKCILPISETTFWEVQKQRDFRSFKETSILIENLSKGICIINDEERRSLEFLHFMRKGQGKDTYEVKELVWTKLGINVLYSNLPHSERTSDKIRLINLTEEISFSKMISIIKQNGGYSPFVFKDNVDFLNSAKEQHKDEDKSFKLMFLSELGGYLDLFKDSLNQSMSQLYYWDSGRYPTEQEMRSVNSNQLTNVIYNLFKYEKITNELPTLSIFPKLMATVRWDQKRKYRDGNDVIDFLHATVALPYFDFFFTEKDLKSIINKAQFGSAYSCRVESNPSKVLELLEVF